ncbi:MAG TPA: hypothetical protein VNJ12_03620 [Candidatus Dormibacteraeota bacterium]|nr:hypothetical protein [Candidatus Dormibacteraeota bacterium]
MTIPQAMNIDAFNSNPTYTTNTLIFEIDSSTIYSKIELQVGGTAQECENYPSMKGHCK